MNSIFKKPVLLTAFALFASAAAWAGQSLSLAGRWEVSIDSLRTFRPIGLPTTLDIAGIGTPNTLKPELRKPQLLHLTRKHSFVGKAFYRRSFDVSKQMADRPLTLTLERVIWQSRVWVDGKPIEAASPQGGETEESLTTPHHFIIPDGLKEGRHEMLISIDNRKIYDISYQNMAHAYTNETQVMWNGILGQITLRADDAMRIASVQTFPNVKDKSLGIRTTLIRTTSKKRNWLLDYSVGDICRSRALRWTSESDTLTVTDTVSLGDNVRLWDEFSPNLYTLRVSVGRSKTIADSHETIFGMREISAKNGHFLVNGNRTFLRGTLECCVFPLTGCPPTDAAGWRKVFTTAKAWGMNHLRFHSYCPPEAAFQVADSMGFYLQVELPVWSLHIGQDASVNRFLKSEYDRIVLNYGNHPSLCLLSVGNELQPDFTFLNQLVHYMRGHDPRHLYITSSFTFEKGHGTHPEPEDQFFVTQWTNKGWVRGQGVFDAEQPNFNKDYRTAEAGINVPVVQHEVGQYSVYPNVREIEKYTGALDPLNLKAIRDDLQRKGLIDKADDYLMASGKLAVQLYKEEIERALKTSGIDGYQLLGLQDFPGQSTALVGLVDAFWDSKGLTSPEYFRQFNAPVVPLVRFDKATWSSDETFRAQVEIANYSKTDLKGKTVDWSLRLADKVIANGSLEVSDIVKGQLTSIGNISVTLRDVKDASQLTLDVGIRGTKWHNNWHVWVYPAQCVLPKSDVVMTQVMDVALHALRKGRTVLFSPKPENTKGLEGKFLPVFWSPVHFPKQAGTMGLLINPKHPALAHFPTEMHSDWQWWNLVKRSRVMVLDSISGATPIIEDVDNFANNRRLSSAFEARCGAGKLLYCSMDVLSDATGKPEVKQLLYSLLSYMTTPAFSPKGEVTPSQLRGLWEESKKQTSTNANSIYE